MSTPQHPFLDLTRYAAQLGDPAKYFVHPFDSRAPIVIEHATGRPVWAIDAAGNLRSFADLAAGKIPPGELPDHEPQPHVYKFGPRPMAGSARADAAALPGTIAFGVTVTPPKGS
jgi:hypothetical protein